MTIIWERGLFQVVADAVEIGFHAGAVAGVDDFFQLGEFVADLL